MGVERRQQPRVLMPWVMEVVYQVKTKRYRRTVLDISTGGMFIQSKHAPPDNCELEILLEVEGVPIRCHARVVHSRAEVGFGILYTDIADEDRDRIRDLVHHVSALVGQTVLSSVGDAP